MDAYTYPNPLIISLFFIEMKCLSDVIWDLKRENKSLAKGGFKLGSTSTQKVHTLPSTPLKLMFN